MSTMRWGRAVAGGAVRINAELATSGPVRYSDLDDLPRFDER
jgi:hypothetical protein